MHMHRRSFIGGAIGLGVSQATSVFAQSYPNRAIRLIVPIRRAAGLTSLHGLSALQWRNLSANQLL
jgi:hypothetical protein